MSRTSDRRRRGPVLGALIAVLLLAFTAATARLFVWPPTSEAATADAIVVLGARSRPERLPEGLRLAEAGVAPTLVLVAPPQDRDVCRDRPHVEVLCIQPEPFSTRGDARAVGRLAVERGWDALQLVTSSYHVTRATMHLRRCFAGRIYSIGATPHDDVVTSISNVVHEWTGLIAAVTLARGC